MTQAVTIVDYGSGNLLSVARAFEHCGASTSLSHDPAEIERAEKLVLPGVGAFADGMQGLYERGLIDPIKRYAASGRPLLGICLGMQMLATTSTEFGSHAGLGLIPGTVESIPTTARDGTRHRIPRIGWCELNQPAGRDWQGTILKDTLPGTSAYLVHSFHLHPDDPNHVLAQYEYGGHSITAAVKRENVTGCQFHPEKSGQAGLRMLASFLSLCTLPAAA